jgi:hypothetical protein
LAAAPSGYRIDNVIAKRPNPTDPNARGIRWALSARPALSTFNKQKKEEAEQKEHTYCNKVTTLILP